MTQFLEVYTKKGGSKLIPVSSIRRMVFTDLERTGYEVFVEDGTDHSVLSGTADFDDVRLLYGTVIPAHAGTWAIFQTPDKEIYREPIVAWSVDPKCAFPMGLWSSGTPDAILYPDGKYVTAQGPIFDTEEELTKYLSTQIPY